MPKFDDPFVSYYGLERANLLEQLERMQTGAWKVLDHSIDITPQRIENTLARLARPDALADALAVTDCGSIQRRETCFRPPS